MKEDTEAKFHFAKSKTKLNNIGRKTCVNKQKAYQDGLVTVFMGTANIPMF